MIYDGNDGNSDDQVITIPCTMMMTIIDVHNGDLK